MLAEAYAGLELQGPLFLFDLNQCRSVHRNFSEIRQYPIS
jgi:hypothetical protein